MRASIIAKIGLFMLSAMLVSTLTGCANDLREQKDDTEIKQEQIEQIEQKWDMAMENDADCVAKIEIASSTSQHMLSSAAIVLESKSIENDSQIALIIDLLSEQNISFEEIPRDMEGLTAYKNSKAGMKTLQLDFLDINGQQIIGIELYEDDSMEIWHTEFDSDGSKSKVFTHLANLPTPIFSAVESVYTSIE